MRVFIQSASGDYNMFIDDAGVPADLVFDGSFVTTEIDPDDADFAVVVKPEYYENCGSEAKALLDWIDNDRTIKRTHLCDPYLCVEYQKDHVMYFEGIQNREFWVKFYAESIIYKRVRGVAIITPDGYGDCGETASS